MNPQFAAKHAPGKFLRVFDFDETLASTGGKPWLVNKVTGEERRLDQPGDRPGPDDQFDWREFTKYLKEPVRPIPKYLQRLRGIVDDSEHKTIVLTARSEAQPVKDYLKKEHGINVEVIGLGVDDPAVGKRNVIEEYIKEGFTNIQFWDDSASNIREISALKAKYPDLNISAYKVPVERHSSTTRVLNYDFRRANTTMVDPMVTIEEHPGVEPVSYMAYQNIVSIMHDANEIMEMMNSCDDLPQWVDQCLSEAADRVGKAKRYIMGEKSKGGSGQMPAGSFGGSTKAGPHMHSGCVCGCEACGAGTCHCPPECECGCRAGDQIAILDYSC